MTHDTDPQRTACQAAAPNVAEFLDSALGLVESQCIRDWVNTQHNRPIWEAIVAGWLEKLHGPIRDDERLRLSAYIVCVALG
jgi:hypothetical protein